MVLAEPMARPCTPEEGTWAVPWPCSDETLFDTGLALSVADGLLAR